MTEPVLHSTVELMQNEPYPGRLSEAYEISKKDRHAAIAAYEELVSHGSTLAKLYLGYVYRGLGEFEKAAIWFDQAYQAGSVEGALHMGLSKARNGLWIEAERYFRDGSKYDPICRYNLADAIIRISGRKYNLEEIEILYKSAVCDGSLRAQNRLAFLYMGGARGFIWRIRGVIIYFHMLYEAAVEAFKDSQSRRLW